MQDAPLAPIQRTIEGDKLDAIVHAGYVPA